jgi:TolB-like protein/class 3 adenylate cyclase/Tfp pilus assembly protein PilF
VNAHDTPAEFNPDLPLEIAHLLLIDVVGYSKLLVDEQIELLQELNQIVRSTECFRMAETSGRLIRVPTGDGMALLFFRSAEEPVRCALEISRTLQDHQHIQVRMGVHSGPVNPVTDVNEKTNFAGSGINIAQRVMDCGDAGHILLSKHVAEDLAEYRHWHPYLHDLGECEVKYGLRLHLFNLYRDELGNPQVPEKLKRGKRSKPTPAVRPITSPRWPKIALIVALLVIAVTLVINSLIFFHRVSAPRPTSALSEATAASWPTAIPEKSIAVLPFENLSDEKENAYFADGVQDEILTGLAKVADLKVISRTSVMQYKSGIARNLREVAKELGVAHLLGGSVQRAGGRVRVSAQLVDARTDRQLWGQTYDRDLADVFAIQTDLAQKIATELRAKLSPSEKAQIERRPTENTEAYLAFMQGHEMFYRPDKFRSNTEKAEQLLEKATKLDPNFADAFAALAWVHDWNYHDFDPTPARKEKARAAADEALRLQPNLPEAHLAMGFYHYYCERDYQAALDEFAIAKQSLPNSADVYLAIGAIERRQGKWKEATASLEKAASLSPKDSWVMQNLADNYYATRNFEAADKIFDRAIEAAPQSFLLRADKAKLAIDWKGDLSVLEKELRQVPTGVDPDGFVSFARMQLLLLQRKFSDALAVLQQSPQFYYYKPRELFEGAIYTFLNDREKAFSAFERARPIAEKALRESPDDASRHVTLGLILAGLGEKEAAIAEGKRAVELLPESQDALDGPQMTVGLAQIYAWTGQRDQALQLLERSLSTPNGITVPVLRLDPFWDPLRSDPRFQELCKDKQPNPRKASSSS